MAIKITIWPRLPYDETNPNRYTLSLEEGIRLTRTRTDYDRLCSAGYQDMCGHPDWGFEVTEDGTLVGHGRTLGKMRRVVKRVARGQK